MNNLIDENIERIIYKIASKYRHNFPIEDLFQVGIIGALKASKNFSNTYDTKFTTYAYNYILGEIVDYVNKDRNIKVSSSYLKIYKRYEQLKDILTQKLSRIPSNNEIALVMNIDEKLLEDVIVMSEYELSLDNMINDNTTNYYDVLEDSKNNLELSVEMKNILSTLTEEERKLINYRYISNYTQNETAKILNINQVQVSRIEKKAKQKIRTLVYM